MLLVVLLVDIWSVKVTFIDVKSYFMIKFLNLPIGENLQYIYIQFAPYYKYYVRQDGLNLNTTVQKFIALHI